MNSLTIGIRRLALALFVFVTLYSLSQAAGAAAGALSGQCNTLKSNGTQTCADLGNDDCSNRYGWSAMCRFHYEKHASHSCGCYDYSKNKWVS